MFGVVTESLESYDRVRLPRIFQVNVGGNVGVSEAVLGLLRIDPSLSAAAIAHRLDKTSQRTGEALQFRMVTQKDVLRSQDHGK